MDILKLTVDESGNWLLSGTLTRSNVEKYYKSFCSKFPTTDSGVWKIDLADVNSIDSSGIAFLLTMLRHASLYSLTFNINNFPKKYMSMLRAYGLREVLGAAL